MNDVPKFVRQRLEQPAAGEHPDANALAAFAEGALTQGERTQVLAHLSECAACREVMSLALPEIPAGAPAAAPAGIRWARWPMLRWAGVAAAVVVVAGAVLVENARRPAAKPTGEEPVARQSETKQAEATLADAKGAPSASENRVQQQESGASRVSGELKAESRADKKKDAIGGVAAKAAPARPLSSNEPAPSQVQGGSLARGIPASPPAVSTKAAAPTAAVAGAEPARQQPLAAVSEMQSARDSVETMAQADASTARKAKTEGGERFALNRRESARPAAAPPVASGGPMMKTALSEPAHWRISPEGSLENSTDAGRTWRFVRVGAPATAFRSVSIVGHDLWAGGTSGVLYHSPDNGRTWQRVTIKAGDAVLESDIARVEFTDERHGTVTTTTGEAWTTADGGATWAAQR